MWAGDSNVRALATAALTLGLLAAVPTRPAQADPIVIVTFENEANVISPDEGDVIYVPRSAPFATVTATGKSHILYFATSGAAVERVLHFAYIQLDSTIVSQSHTNFIAPFALGDLSGWYFDHSVTQILGAGRHSVRVNHKLETLDSVVQEIADDYHEFFIVPVDMPVPSALSLGAFALAALGAQRVRRVPALRRR